MKRLGKRWVHQFLRLGDWCRKGIVYSLHNRAGPILPIKICKCYHRIDWSVQRVCWLCSSPRLLDESFRKADFFLSSKYSRELYLVSTLHNGGIIWPCNSRLLVSNFELFFVFRIRDPIISLCYGIIVEFFDVCRSSHSFNRYST